MRDLDRPRQSEELKRVQGHVADDYYVRGHCCVIRSVSRLLLLRRTLAVIGDTRLLGQIWPTEITEPLFRRTRLIDICLAEPDTCSCYRYRPKVCRTYRLHYIRPSPVSVNPNLVSIYGPITHPRAGF